MSRVSLATFALFVFLACPTSIVAADAPSLYPAIGGVLIVIVIVIGVFLIIRDFFCWYWRINERLKIEQEILAQLKILNDKMAQMPEDIVEDLVHRFRKKNERYNDETDGPQ